MNIEEVSNEDSLMSDSSMYEMDPIEWKLWARELLDKSNESWVENKMDNFWHKINQRETLTPFYCLKMKVMGFTYKEIGIASGTTSQPAKTKIDKALRILRHGHWSGHYRVARSGNCSFHGS